MFAKSIVKMGKMERKRWDEYLNACAYMVVQGVGGSCFARKIEISQRNEKSLFNKLARKTRDYPFSGPANLHSTHFKMTMKK